MINPMELTGKHIMITGASSGIGRATCILTSQLGAKVSLIARDEARLTETLSQMDGEGHKIYPADLTRLDEIENLVKRIVSEQGAADGFVHCAGITANRPVTMEKPDLLDAMIKSNFFTFAEMIRVLSKKRASHTGASLIGVSSVAGLCGAKAQAAYAASKAAMNGFIHPAAKELAGRNIRVNTVAFGMIETNMFDIFKRNGGSEEKLLEQQYLGLGQPKDAANVIAFLLSDASRFITGTTLIADGGNLS